ncbi:glycosyltransferase family 2 protein, partial [Geminisphaera colitermitum]|uniref:glycosyltransferase family 2 protein n=1 Tax=Geminisphaera colitermitum TaxID=1148786 RepID=UPI000693DE4C
PPPPPLVSILIPCHNAARWLGATLDSALAQTWPRCEIIVIDDGSTDDSPRLAASYADRGVQLLRQPQRGAAAARNAALNRARGDYLQFLDADDLLAPEKIASQITRLAAAPAGSVASAAWTRFRDDPSISQFIPEPVWCDALPLDWLVLSWSGGGMMHPAAWLVPAAVAHAAGPWNETLSLDDDGEYFTRVLLASAGVVHCPEARVYYRTHATGSLSQTKNPAAWRSSHDVCLLVQQAALAHENSPRVRHACALNHLRYAFHAWPHSSARALARASLREARRLDPTARRPASGPRFERLAALIGWKAARILQHQFHLS